MNLYESVKTKLIEADAATLYDKAISSTKYDEVEAAITGLEKQLDYEERRNAVTATSSADLAYLEEIKGYIIDLKNKLDNMDECDNLNLKEYTTDQYGDRTYNYDEAVHYLDKFCKTVNEKFKDYEYEFDWRIESGSFKVFDKCEYFDYEDSNFDAINKIVKDIFGKDAYLEPENRVVMVIARAYLKETDNIITEDEQDEYTSGNYRIIITTNVSKGDVHINDEDTYSSVNARPIAKIEQEYYTNALPTKNERWQEVTSKGHNIMAYPSLPRLVTCYSDKECTNAVGNLSVIANKQWNEASRKYPDDYWRGISYDMSQSVKILDDNSNNVI